MASKSKYIHIEKEHNEGTATIVVPYLLNILNPNSVLDIGCGIGTWLSVFNKNGIKDFIGIDGYHTKEELLTIPKNNFVRTDLEKPFSLERKFDLAISLEVAEHLSEKSAVDFINSICKHTNIVLFSAATVKQGGQNHINEQRLSYWVEKFNNNNFILKDIIRQEFWNNENIDIWYKQNMVLFVKEDLNLDLPVTRSLIDVIHPELYESKLNQIEEGRMGFIFPFKILISTLKRGIKRLTS